MKYAPWELVHGSTIIYGGPGRSVSFGCVELLHHAKVHGSALDDTGAAVELIEKLRALSVASLEAAAHLEKSAKLPKKSSEELLAILEPLKEQLYRSWWHKKSGRHYKVQFISFREVDLEPCVNYAWSGNTDLVFHRTVEEFLEKFQDTPLKEAQ